MSKSIYSKGFIYEGVGSEDTFPMAQHEGQYDKFPHFPVLNSHNFKEGQEVVEGKDYEKRYQASFLGSGGKQDWTDCSEWEYNQDPINERRIVAIALNVSVQEEKALCTCKPTDKNHALCPVCDKEEFEKTLLDVEMLKADKKPSAHLTEKGLRTELWNMLTDRGRQEMLPIKDSYIESLMADIDDYCEGKIKNAAPTEPTTNAGIDKGEGVEKQYSGEDMEQSMRYGYTLGVNNIKFKDALIEFNNWIKRLQNYEQ